MPKLETNQIFTSKQQLDKRQFIQQKKYLNLMENLDMQIIQPKRISSVKFKFFSFQTLDTQILINYLMDDTTVKQLFKD